MHRSLLLAVPATLVVLVVGCATAPPTSAPGVDPSPDALAAPGAADDAPDDGGSDDGGSEGRGPGATAARIHGDRIVVTDGAGPRDVATVTDGELLHVAVRPGTDGPTTVLALVRTTAGPFELRYLDLAAATGEPTDLYGFPWRLQVDPASAERAADAPPLPVWSPDGDAVAWLEVGDDGVHLRTQRWLVHEEGSNPAEDGTEARLDDVPPGAALTGWTRDGGTDVLTATTPDGDELVLRLVADGVDVA